jgi:16S rRNA (cytosine1402-N4)-methyltransferase
VLSPEREEHRSVLLHETIEALALSPSDTVVDATLGGAGHARAIARCLDAEGVLIGVDADKEAVLRARDVLRACLPAGRGLAPSIRLVEANFRDLAMVLEKEGVRTITKALFDLGWSSYHLEAERGFSFRAPGPLKMTYSSEQALTAEVAVNEWSEESLADVIYGFGEERFARRIARMIVEAREKKRITRTDELAEIISAAMPAKARHGRIHPATKTFQALRIAVNDELGALTQGLSAAWEKLVPGGRIAVIAFHSIEDRHVKRQFLEWERAGKGVRITKRPIVPTEAEISANPRSRSAKLRVIEKI